MKRILIVAGETSGDLHGSALMREIKTGAEGIFFRGIGGTLMVGEGLDAIRHVRDMNFMGLVEVLRHLPFIKKTLNDLEALLDSWNPDLVILIDYPGFNLRFAPLAKKRGIPVMYYISPQLWAWHKSRVKLIRRYVDRMVVLFDFEVDFYEKHGVRADFVGHPLLDAVRPGTGREEFRASLGATDIPLIGLLPGSRPQEIERILPAMVAGVEKLRSRMGKLVAVIGCAPELDLEIIEHCTGESDIGILHDNAYDIMAHADAVAVTSGTATLETGILGTPMVIVYRTSFLTYLIGSRLVKIDNIGLINIVAGARVVPELWQNEVTADNIAARLEKLCLDRELRGRISSALSGAKSKLGDTGASKRAAAIALDMLKSRLNPGHAYGGTKKA